MDDLKITQEVEKQLKKRSEKNKGTGLKIIALVFVVLIILSIFLMSIEDENSTRTMTGKTLSWSTNPYQSIGNIMLIISVICLIVVTIWGIGRCMSEK